MEMVLKIHQKMMGAALLLTSLLAVAQPADLVKKAQQGDATAQYDIGQILEAKDFKLIAEAARWYRLAAEQGHAKAQSRLGLLLLIGTGEEQNDFESAYWYRRAAMQGDLAGESSLGVLLENGRGVTQNYVEAVHWYRRAAERGEVGAQSNLGKMLEDGRGVAQNYTEAVYWYRRAAEQDDAKAQARLGLMLINGKGVAHSVEDAYFWLSLAAAKDSTYQELRDRAAKLLTTEKLNRVQSRTATWKPRKEIAPG